MIRLRSLGDCVLTTPALALLKQYRPDVRVAVCVEDRFRAVFELNPDVELILPPSIAAAAKWRPGLCLNLHGGTRSIALTFASAAPWRAGFGHFRAAFLYNIRIPRAQVILGAARVVHTAEHLASAIFHLGVPISEIPRARLFVGSPPENGGRAYAVLHPLASAPDKTWPAHHFRTIADHLQTQLNIEPVFTAAAGEDMGAFTEYRTLIGAPLEKTKELLAGASLFIGNDSGPAHMAAAFGIPVVVLFGASDQRIWSPWKTASEVLSSSAGIASISPLRVIEALERLRVKA